MGGPGEAYTDRQMTIAIPFSRKVSKQPGPHNRRVEAFSVVDTVVISLESDLSAQDAVTDWEQDRQARVRARQEEAFHALQALAVAAVAGGIVSASKREKRDVETDEPYLAINFLIDPSTVQHALDLESYLQDNLIRGFPEVEESIVIVCAPA